MPTWGTIKQTKNQDKKDLFFLEKIIIIFLRKLANDELRYMTGTLFMHSLFLVNLEKLKL